MTEQNITWEELCNFAKKYGAIVYISRNFFQINDLCFTKTGGVNYMSCDIAIGIDYYKMKAIIENLFDEVE